MALSFFFVNPIIKNIKAHIFEISSYLKYA